jgi:hypothetical protein
MRINEFRRCKEGKLGKPQLKWMLANVMLDKEILQEIVKIVVSQFETSKPV